MDIRPRENPERTARASSMRLCAIRRREGADSRVRLSPRRRSPERSRVVGSCLRQSLLVRDRSSAADKPLAGDRHMSSRLDQRYGHCPRPLGLCASARRRRAFTAGDWFSDSGGEAATRALLSAPEEGTDPTYREFIRRAQCEALLADHLVQGEPYLSRNALVLSQRDASQLKDLTACFGRAFAHAARALARDAATVESLGFPWAAAELMCAEGVRTPLVGRFDFVQEASGHWWLLEFNADTPSGIREATVVDRLMWESSGSPAGLRRPNRLLAHALTSAFSRALHGLPKGARLGLLVDAGELEDLAQMAFTERLLRPGLGRQGIEVILGDVDDLRPTRRGLSLRGRPVAAVYRYVPFESMFGTPAFAALYDAVVKGSVLLLNGLGGLLLQHKGLLPWLWEHRDDRALPARTRIAAQEFLPPTWWMAAMPEEEAHASVVAKQVFGREGEEVFFGEDLDSNSWQELAQRRTYVVQRRIHVAEFDAAIQSSLGPRRRLGTATVGRIAVEGSR